MGKEKLLYLEGLRGVAAMLVFLNHLKATFAINYTHDLLVYLKESTGVYFVAHIGHALVSLILDAGMASVYVFWFMSAYVISIKLHSKNGNEYLLKSFAKRYFRLLVPVAASVIVSYLFLSFDLFFNDDLAQVLGPEYTMGWLEGYFNFQPSFSAVINTSFWSTFFVFNEYTPYNPVLWTMYPELLGSFFIFAVFAIAGKTKVRNIIYLAISITTFGLELYWLTSFVFGFWYCDFKHSGQQGVRKSYLFNNRIINLVLLVIVLILIGKQNFIDSSNLVLSSLLVVLVIETEVFQKFFSKKLLVWLGKNSFSLYLLHFAMICSLGCYLYLVLDFSHEINILLASTLTIVVTLILSSFFTKYVDMSGVRLANTIGDYVVRKILPKGKA